MTALQHWYAVYTKPRWEKKVASTFNEKNITCYCPLNKVIRQWSDRKKMVLEPLFRSYVFVRITDKEQIVVKQVDGVVSFVKWLGKPAIIRDEEIETIQRFLNEHTNIQLEKTAVQVNDTVRIINGPLMEQVGNVVMVKSSRIKVVLPSLGYIMSAEVECGDVEVIHHQKENKTFL